MTPRETTQEIRDVMSQVIRAGLSNEQKYPAIRKMGQFQTEIFIEGSPDLSVSLKGLPYSEIYASLEAGGAFNLRMIDGSLIQMMYTFTRNKIQTHRLSLFPSPSLDPYEEAQLSYERDELFAEFSGSHMVKFPVRFDFSETEHIDGDHPKSHLTLGQYKNCRLPVSSPLSPRRFMRFILRSFYWPAFKRVGLPAPNLDLRFPESISANEKQLSFLSA